jgi:cytochrome oxidase Cu insertion factor (SCO1/SenC/PrrC family)
MKSFLIVLSCLLISYGGFSQTKAATDNTPEYIKNPAIPDFTIYTAPDSATFTNHDLKKNKPVLLMIFSPECGHCQNETKELEKNIDHFKNVQIVMVTWLPYQEMMAFYHDYKIAEYPQITMGWDKKDFFLPYYHVQMYPDLVVYSKEGKYVNSFSGSINLEDVARALNQ